MNTITPNDSNNLINPDQLRREVAEIIRRHKRGLPAYRGEAAPPPVKPELERAEELLSKGRAYLAQKELAEALIQADIAIGMAPAGSQLLPDCWTLRGQIRLQQGNIQTARQAFQQAMLLNPAHIGARLGMAETFRRAHEDARAIPLYIETIPLIRNVEERTRLRLLVADCYVTIGKPEAARRVLRTVESTKGLSSVEKMRAAFTMLIPDNMIMWFILTLLMTIVAAFAIDLNAVAGVMSFIVGIMMYGALQWWRTPVH